MLGLAFSFLEGCRGDGAAGGRAATALPDNGVVWTISSPENRASAAAALEAMVYGAHILLTDGDDAYAGSARSALAKQPDGTWSLTLPGGARAALDRSDSALVLHLPSGATLPLVRQAGTGAAAGPRRVVAHWAGYPSFGDGSSSWQAPPELDDEAVALTWHKVARVPFDAAAVTSRNKSLQQLPAFDRPDSARVWAQQLDARLTTLPTDATFRVRVNDNVSEYDHAQQRFSVHFFEPGTYLPLQVFGEEYRVVFSNADAARFINMSKDAARPFDESLRAQGRGVLTDITFRVTGQGDPAGAVTGARVVRAELVEVHVRDRQEVELFSPALSASPTAQNNPTAFDLAAADVAGLRVGTAGDLFERSASRLYGKTERRANKGSGYAGFTSIIAVNEMGCSSIPGRGRVKSGAVCATAFLDGDDIVRSIRIERVFPFIDGEAFRKVLVQRYGPVADAAQRTGYTLAWGPVTDSTTAYLRSGPHNALTATWSEDEDMMSRSLNAAPRIRVTLQLTDATWIAAQSR
ncbi:DUF4852 domain-containing protein [Gemmatimonas groenlandica]|uniref:DUF4852 domain-containing protein n=1 Tax=Gemmatimonas groenlandica TaxID=2732249 RepID=A0A6M4IR30_9BACT|nr:DUF4852 domain-containing protein [Gemmatimonas groenlandica]QJR35937.1 DUF4852 domain-containing protein [Gemmatimonas groenlandica]